MSKKRVSKVQPIKPTNGNGGPPQVPEKPQVNTFLVDGNVLQRTVEMLAGLALTHPASVQRDQLCAYYTSLKSIESIGKSNDNSG
jgi:hypothetical protein